MGNSSSKTDHYVLGGAALGWIIEALRLRVDIPTMAATSPKTVDRFLGGDRIKDASVQALIRGFVSVLAPDDVAKAIDVDDKGWQDFRRQLEATTSMFIHSWSVAAGSLNAASAAVSRREHAYLPWVRLAVIDLAFRYGAYLRLRGLPPQTEEQLVATCEAKAFAYTFDRYRGSPSALSHDVVAERANVSRNQPAEWSSGRALPQSENLRDLAAAFAATRKEGAAIIELHLRCAVAASVLVGELTKTAGPAVATSYVRSFFDLSDFVSWFLSQSRLPKAELKFRLLDLIAAGVRANGAHAILNAAARNTLDQFFEGDLRAADGDWTERLRFWNRILAGEEEAVSTLVRETKVEPKEAAKLIALVQTAMLRLPTLGIPDDLQVMRVSGDSKFSARNHESQYVDAMSRGDFAAAAHHARRMIELVPGEAKYHFWLGTALSGVGHPDDAIAECLIANELRGGWSLAFVEVAIIQLDHGRTDAAIATLADARSRFGADPHLSYHQGVAALRQQRFTDALVFFDETLSSKPEHPLALDLKAHCLFALGKSKEGLKCAKEAAHRGQPETIRLYEAGFFSRAKD